MGANEQLLQLDFMLKVTLNFIDSDSIVDKYAIEESWRPSAGPKS